MEKSGREELIAAMCAVWAEVLGTPVEADDDFFAIGGDSLAAAQIEALAGERLGVSVDATDFLVASSPRTLIAEALGRGAQVGFD
jgi:acyl carrier protein